MTVGSCYKEIVPVTRWLGKEVLYICHLYEYGFMLCVRDRPCQMRPLNRVNHAGDDYLGLMTLLAALFLRLSTLS